MRWLDITNHHQLRGPEFEQAPREGEGQGSRVSCSPRGHKESDATEHLNRNNLCKHLALEHTSSWGVLSTHSLTLSFTLKPLSTRSGVGRVEGRRSPEVSLLPPERGGVTQLAGLVRSYFPGERASVPAGRALRLDLATTRAVSPGGLSSNASLQQKASGSSLSSPHGLAATSAGCGYGGILTPLVFPPLFSSSFSQRYSRCQAECPGYRRTLTLLSKLPK